MPLVFDDSMATIQSTRLLDQLVAVIGAVRTVEDFSDSINRPVRFTAADIRALAISSFIEQSRRRAA